eukprot:1815832-Heterocapsa_arctica.AAC.1
MPVTQRLRIGPGQRLGCSWCGGPHGARFCRNAPWARNRLGQQQPTVGGQRQPTGWRQQAGPRQNPSAENLRCLQCGRWGHRRANCRVVNE